MAAQRPWARRTPSMSSRTAPAPPRLPADEVDARRGPRRRASAGAAETPGEAQHRQVHQVVAHVGDVVRRSAPARRGSRRRPAALSSPAWRTIAMPSCRARSVVAAAVRADSTPVSSPAWRAQTSAVPSRMEKRFDSRPSASSRMRAVGQHAVDVEQQQPQPPRAGGELGRERRPRRLDDRAPSASKHLRSPEIVQVQHADGAPVVDDDQRRDRRSSRIFSASTASVSGPIVTGPRGHDVAGGPLEDRLGRGDAAGAGRRR